MDAFNVQIKQVINDCGLSIRKFVIILDQFRGKNHYIKVGMVSKSISNFHQCILSKDDKYKLVDRAYQENIKAFTKLSQELNSNQFKVDAIMETVKKIRVQFEGHITLLLETKKRVMETKSK